VSSVRTLPGMPSTPKLSEYSEEFKDIFTFDRSELGVLTVKWHEGGDSAPWTLVLHRSLPEMLKTAGRDIENEVFVIGGTGKDFLQYMTIPQLQVDPKVAALGAYVNQPDQRAVAQEPDNFFWLSYEHIYYDGCRMIEAIVNDIEVPTIGVINGSGVHSELALLCDITLMAEEAIIVDPHMRINWPSGDGIQIAFRIAAGYKRATYAMLTAKEITAQEALDWGMVNEVVPRDRIYQRAQEIAEELAARDRILRRVNTQILRAPLRQAVAQELRGSLGTELFSALATHNVHRSKD
jgi:enoyl-CoA hydratase/carnithine racemase